MSRRAAAAALLLALLAGAGRSAEGSRQFGRLVGALRGAARHLRMVQPPASLQVQQAVQRWVWAAAAQCRRRRRLHLTRTHPPPCPSALHMPPLHPQLRQAPTNGSSGGQGGGGRYPDPALKDAFVAVKDGDFVLGCRKFPVSGLNA